MFIVLVHCHYLRNYTFSLDSPVLLCGIHTRHRIFSPNHFSSINCLPLAKLLINFQNGLTLNYTFRSLSSFVYVHLYNVCIVRAVQYCTMYIQYISYASDNANILLCSAICRRWTTRSQWAPSRCTWPRGALVRARSSRRRSYRPSSRSSVRTRRRIAHVNCVPRSAPLLFLSRCPK